MVSVLSHFIILNSLDILLTNLPINCTIYATTTGDMYVDEAGPYRGTAAGRFQGLDLVEPLYLGGVPDFRSIHRLTGHSQGFVGMFV